MISERDLTVVEQMYKYCAESSRLCFFFRRDETEFQNNPVFRNAIAMPVQQIGELAGHLSDEFRSEYNSIEWRSMIGMRNWFAHEYYRMDIDTIWDVALYDIPDIKDFCRSIIEKSDSGGIL